MDNLTVEQKATQTYLDNITYFKEYQPNLYEKISSFESAVDKGYYKERYELEYKDAGYFDVRELESGNYLYGKNSYDYAKLALKGTNYKKSESVFETFKDFIISEQLLKEIKDKDIAENALHGIGEIIHYTQSVTDKSMHLKEIKKFIFIGVGLGTHITMIDKKINSEYYLIVEDDLELFRLSMFVTNYKLLSEKANLKFCIFEETKEAKQIFQSFLSKGFYYNHYIKFFQMLNHSDEKMNLIHSAITEQSHLIFPYNAYFKVHLRALEHLKNGYRFLNLSKTEQNDLFLKKPVLLVAAGPSLGKNIKWLEKNRDKFIIVSVTAALKKLEDHGIKPDIITHIDPFEDVCMTHINRLKSQDFIKDCMLICGSQTPSELIERFKKNRVFIFQNSISYKKDFGTFELSCVGSATYTILTLLGTKQIYLLGLDLALDSKTGSSHMNDHFQKRDLDISKSDQIQDSLNYSKAIIKTKGNFKDEVKTLLTFFRSIQNIKYYQSIYQRKDQKVYNLNDGAYLEGSIPKKIDEIEIEMFETLNKSDILNNVFEQLMSKSTNELDENELESIKLRLKNAKNIKEIISRAENITASQSDIYKYRLLTLTLDIIENSSVEAENLHTVYLRYMEYILPYIFDMLNTKELKNEKRHIKKIHKRLIKKYSEIALFYEKRYEDFLEKELVH